MNICLLACEYSTDRGMALYVCGTVPADLPMGLLSHLQFESFHATGLSSHGLPPASGYTLHARMHLCMHVGLILNTEKGTSQI